MCVVNFDFLVLILVTAPLWYIICTNFQQCGAENAEISTIFSANLAKYLKKI